MWRKKRSLKSTSKMMGWSLPVKWADRCILGAWFWSHDTFIKIVQISVAVKKANQILRIIRGGTEAKKKNLRCCVNLYILNCVRLWSSISRWVIPEMEKVQKRAEKTKIASDKSPEFWDRTIKRHMAEFYKNMYGMEMWKNE